MLMTHTALCFNAPQETPPPSYSDPFSLVKQELKIVAERLRRSILSDIPLLERAGAYFFDVGAQVHSHRHC